MSDYITIKGGPPPNPTVILYPDGSVMLGVLSCNININGESQVARATLDVLVDDLNIQAEPLLSLETVKAAAEHYGYKLVKK